TLQSTDAEQAEGAARRIAERLRLETKLVSSAIWEPPWLEHPEQAAELLAYLWLNQPPQKFSELADRLAPQKLSKELRAIREELATSLSTGEMARMSYDPFGFTRLPQESAGAAPAFGQGEEMFSSSDRTFRILYVKSAQDLTSYPECERWLTRIK